MHSQLRGNFRDKRRNGLRYYDHVTEQHAFLKKKSTAVDANHLYGLDREIRLLCLMFADDFLTLPHVDDSFAIDKN